jgi:hypothetical protein
MTVSSFCGTEIAGGAMSPRRPNAGVIRFRDGIRAVRSALTLRLEAADVLLAGLSAQQDLLDAILTTVRPTAEFARGGPEE